MSDDLLRHPIHSGHLTVGPLKRNKDKPVLFLGDTTLTGGQLAERISQYIQAFEAEYELLNRGTRAELHGEIELTDQEAVEMRQIMRKKMSAYQRILNRLPKPGRNDPCPCGSGKKFKNCHGRDA